VSSILQLLHPLYIATGALVGLMVGLTGIGGGSLMTPILVVLFGQTPALAVGTDLAFAATTKLCATTNLLPSRQIDWRIVGWLAAGSVPTAVAVLLWLNFTPRPPAAIDSVILHAMAAMLLVTAAGLLLQGFLQRLGLKFTARTLANVKQLQPAITVLTGIALGFAVTLTSVGAGALGTFALLYLYPLRLTPSRLVATDIAHALPLVAVGAIGHAALGHVDFNVLGNLLIGSIPAVLIGTRSTVRAPQWVVRMLVATMLVATGGRILLAV
jgi:uncharacterized membrane protein YfcA